MHVGVEVDKQQMGWLWSSDKVRFQADANCSNKHTKEEKDGTLSEGSHKRLTKLDSC